MSDNDDSSYIFPPPPETAWDRIRHLLRRTLPSTATTLALAVAAFTITEFIVNRVTSPERLWQITDQEHSETLKRLDETSKALSDLAPMLQSNPEASKLLEISRLNVADSISTLRSLPSVERRADIVPSFVSAAYAQAEKKVQERTTDETLRYIAFSLIGFVASVYVVMLIMYGLMKDKTKNPFMERTLNQILGFLFGLITGVLSGQLR